VFVFSFKHDKHDDTLFNLVGDWRFVGVCPSLLIVSVLVDNKTHSLQTFTWSHKTPNSPILSIEPITAWSIHLNTWQLSKRLEY